MAWPIKLSLIDKVDKLILAYLKQSGRFLAYTNTISHRNIAIGGSHDRQAAGDLASIDTKTGPLLSHVSLMIAALAVLLSSTKLSLWKQIFFMSEIAVYLIVAICCLRCIALSKIGTAVEAYSLLKDDGSMSREVIEEAVIKIHVFAFANALALYVTLLLLLTTPLVLVLLP